MRVNAHNAALSALHRLGPRARASAIARQLGVSRNYAGTLLRELERRGLAVAELVDGGFLEWSAKR
jgi:DNA-binding IclR family transcriptional regulator